MTYNESSNWLDAFVNICDFTNFTEEDGWLIHGKVCQRTYFHVSQEAISTMIMAGNLKPLPPSDHKQVNLTEAVMKKHESKGRLAVVESMASFGVVTCALSAALLAAVGLAVLAGRRHFAPRCITLEA